MERVVYSDNAATTPISKNVYNAMLPYLTTGYGNPSSLYSLAREEKKAVDQARTYAAECLNCEPDEIIFTSGGSEADNLALKGLLFGKNFPKNKRHIITSTIEHHAILHTCEFLERIGYEVTYVGVDAQGHIKMDELEQAITENTALVSIMAANNEIGTIQDLKAIAELCHSKGTLFHTDAVQAVGHMKIDVKEMGIDMLSLSGHKIRGPKGIGALYCRKGIVLEPLIHGGGQERGKRSGTENVAGIVGLGEAMHYAHEHMDEYLPYVASLRDRLIEGVLKIPYTQLTGDPVNRLPGTASFVIECIEGESLVLRLDLAGIATSTGSACSTGSLDPSHVLMAIGLPHEIAHGSLRVTLGEQNTVEDVDYLIEKINYVVKTLRDMSPVWDEKMSGQPMLKLFDK
ncbi:cysteine desulfurase NifS [Butyricicoccus sp.]|uniref:cysteine desulfurase NifS n=1 Tax=Butyricicoccus sp. TaxID=2049021 RepID=UPI003736BE5F